MKKRICTLLASGLILASAAGAVTACGSRSSKNTFSNEAVAETTAAAMPQGPASSYTEESLTGNGSYRVPGGMTDGMSADFAAPGETAASRETFSPGEEAEAGSASASRAGLTSGNGIQPVSTNRKLIRTVNLSVETTEFDALLKTLTQAVTSMGGYIEQSDISGNSISDTQGRRYASLTARIPSDKLDHFVSQVDENGNITYKSENTQDVTLQYSDIESRKKTLTVEQERLWELLAKADSMDAVIALESRLSDIRYELESMESQLRTYDNQVDYSYVYLNIDEVKVFTPTTPDSVLTRIQKGFSRNLERVGSGAVNFFVWFISSLPTLVVLAILTAAIVSILRRIFRRRIKKHDAFAEQQHLSKEAPSKETPPIETRQPRQTTVTENHDRES